MRSRLRSRGRDGTVTNLLTCHQPPTSTSRVIPGQSPREFRESATLLGPLLATCWARDGSLVTIFRASPADHFAAWHLLRVSRYPISLDAFHARLDMPGYSPEHRLFAMMGGDLVGHVCLVPLTIRFGRSVVRACLLQELVVRPEFQELGIEEELVERASQAARRLGAVLILFRSPRWRHYLRRGWLAGPRCCFTAIAPCQLLAHIRRFPRPLPDWWDRPRPPQWIVRQARRLESDAMLRLYEDALHAPPTITSYGGVVRAAEYWQWLFTRGGCDRVYVAVQRWFRPNGEEPLDTVHGYMAVRQGRVVELVESSQPGALEALLTRAADDAVEGGWHALRFDAPPRSGLHETLRRFGGNTYHHDVDGGWAWLMQVTSDADWLDAIAEELRARIAVRRSSVPIELGVHLGSQTYCLAVSAEEVSWRQVDTSRHTIELNHYNWLMMLTGRFSAAELLDQRQMRASSRAAGCWAKLLFPAVPWWISAWDSGVFQD